MDAFEMKPVLISGFNALTSLKSYTIPTSRRSCLGIGFRSGVFLKNQFLKIFNLDRPVNNVQTAVRRDDTGNS